MRSIEQYLAERPDLRPIDILVPENCALVLDHNNVTKHIAIESDGSVTVEEV